MLVKLRHCSKRQSVNGETLCKFGAHRDRMGAAGYQARQSINW